MPPFQKNLRGHVWTVPGNTFTKFGLGVRIIRHFNNVVHWSDLPVRCGRTDRQTDTSNENSISTIHCFHLVDIKIINQCLTN